MVILFLLLFCVVNSNCFKVLEYIGVFWIVIYLLKYLYIKVDKFDLLCIIFVNFV